MQNMQQEQQIIEKFKEIKRNQYIATVPLVTLVILLVISAEEPSFELFGISNNILVIAGVVGIVVGMIFSFINWRCPSCNSYLGKEFSPKFCKGCGSQLKE